jgi:hypothetical protein
MCPVIIFQFGNIEFLHAEYGAHRPRRFRLVGIAQHLRQGRRKYSPRDAEPILEPTALLDFATGGQFLPVMVDLFLRLTRKLEGDCFVELE